MMGGDEKEDKEMCKGLKSPIWGSPKGNECLIFDAEGGMCTRRGEKMVIVIFITSALLSSTYLIKDNPAGKTLTATR